MQQSTDSDPNEPIAPTPDLAAAVEGAPKRAVGRKREDTAEGCRAMADADHVRAGDMDTERMRDRMEQSADAWTKRADLLERLEASFSARKEAAQELAGDEEDEKNG
jgi:hypothetical protein